MVSKKSGKSFQSSSNINHTKRERERERRRRAHMFSTTSRRRLISDSDCHRRHKPCIPELWLVSFCSGPGDCRGTCVCVCIVNLRACPALWLYLSVCLSDANLFFNFPCFSYNNETKSLCPPCQPPLPASLAPVSRPSSLHSYFPAPHPSIILFFDVIDSVPSCYCCCCLDCHSQLSSASSTSAAPCVKLQLSLHRRHNVSPK